MNAEHFSQQTMQAGIGKNVYEYKAALDDFSGTLHYIRYPATEKWQISSSRYHTPIYISTKYDASRPAVQAAMWTAAIRTRGENNSLNPDRTIEFSNVWKDTNLQKLAYTCEDALHSLHPTTSNSITTIDVESMKRIRENELLYSYHKEILVFLGLNGAGKDFLIGYLTMFLEFCGIENEVVKMPNEDDVLFRTIDRFLHKKIKLNSNAAQLLMLASGANTELSEGKLSILNRHAMYDTMVYGENDLHPAILATHPLFNVIAHTLIVDRQPSRALQSVKDRGKKQRIFEERLEQGLHLRNRYAALTALAGVRWLDVDFNTTNKKKQVIYSIDRLIAYVMSFGIIQRKLVRTKRVENMKEADELLHRKYREFEIANKLI